MFALVLRPSVSRDFRSFSASRDGNDPAVEVVGRLRREFPAADLAVAIDRRQHGSSRKVSNLINMMALARHEYLVIADSDVRVDRDYLAKVVEPLWTRESAS